MTLELTKKDVGTLVIEIISPAMRDHDERCQGSYPVEGLHRVKPLEITNATEAERQAIIKKLYIENCPLFKIQGFTSDQISDKVKTYDASEKKGKYRDVVCPGLETCRAAVEQRNIEILLD